MSDENCKCLRCTREKDGEVEIVGVLVPVEMTRMFLCATCGNKRCPHSDDHRNACTNSNEPGQVGSRYGVAANA